MGNAYVNEEDYPEDDAAQNELILGSTAHLLAEMGDEQAYLLLEDVSRLSFRSEHRGQYSDEHDPWGGMPISEWVAYLDVPTHLLESFTDVVIERIAPILRDVADRRGGPRGIAYIETRYALPEIDERWRDRLPHRTIEEEGGGNQARRERLSVEAASHDGLTFANDGEVALYQCLKRLQAATPEQKTIAIAPLPGVRVRAGHTWTPDFLVIGNGRAMVIELDGPHHGTKRRRADDDMRDLQWRRCGVDPRRIPVEYVRPERQDELDKFVKEIVVQTLWR